MLAPLLVVLLAYQLAVLTWLILAPASDTGAGMAVSRGAAGIIGDEHPDYGRVIAQYHLFGEAERTENKPEAMEAPETRLNLKLLGLFATDDERGFAIIQSGGRTEEVYTVGDPISGGATLKQVLNDRVILERDGQLEALKLPAERPPLVDFGPGDDVGGRPLASTPDESSAQSLVEFREQAIRDPSRIGEILDIEPVEEGGQFQGFRLTPRVQDPLFEQVGLMPGDVVTEVNGVTLSSPQQGMLALRKLVNARELDIVVMRGGQPVHIQQALQR